MKKNLIEIKNVKKVFKKDIQQDLLVLENVNFNLREGEIVALLGRSGSGKSTLLRVIAGLIESSAGQVLFRGQPVTEPAQGISMVFQHFALMPWLTVLQNVELGLEAIGVPRKERRQRALKAIDTIGLDGFESAFPKELSGGMRQRVGIARALVVNPDVLLMDEPFSALDVLTADNLRNDLLDLWQQEENKNNSILLVTHNIEEAIFLADRVIVFDSNPGTVRSILKVDISHPRDDTSPEFRSLVNRIYKLMTSVKGKEETEAISVIDLGYRFPDAGVSELLGLAEMLADEETDKSNLAYIADELALDIDDLLSLTEVLDILHFAKQADGEIILTEAGKQFAEADILQRKKIFAAHLLMYVPLVKLIHRVLYENANHRESKRYFIGELEDYLSNEDAGRVLRVVIEWGRYAELFAYDDNSGELNLENPE
ncbi:MAG: nitrate/sulfonate/bicarbonate ABC transporter ATP-binding protein [Pseudomonadota bacterium]|nr:nitrate/sulfonate/bicarbonate ABC transporter ATP-binding protein [Gammaproteobacteria bacterium]MBU1558179.1 nitrate/sulfonate/bicarbonate ABC transporter ATP-binding protein [Gammaproteobacteria bacterium]MBU1629053.1 nitrate/sulfonate/bicarbonate ABC transporter ATP-binding protein [Gammaproteobacteria bacterium]MBU1926595.1 nitrate/sulfonate/bicarbonate ABC transporter ATP-binding protein [Gammaproteobacteria bacterium]MBU2546659.1 nitrate/sulfonate/bicarbonate ABC transporter ATP-bindin